MESYKRPELFLDEINRTRLIILHRFSEMKSVLCERERHLLKELDTIQSNFEVQLNIYKKRLHNIKESFAGVEIPNWNDAEFIVEERQAPQELLPMKKIQFRMIPNFISSLDKIGSIKVIDDNPNTRRRPTYGEERESQLFQLTRRKSKDDFEITQVRKPYLLPIKPTSSAPTSNHNCPKEFHPIKRAQIKTKLTQMTFISKHSSPSAL